jgi:chromosome condensin MukBEF MukE localization factor
LNHIEAALHEIELESLGRLERLPLAQASKELTAIQMRSGGGKVDRDKLNGNDRAIFDRIQRTAYAPANREKNFITNIESLKLLARSDGRQDNREARRGGA